MNENQRRKIESLLAQPDDLLKKKPFYRHISGGNLSQLNALNQAFGGSVGLTDTITAQLPSIRKDIVTQDTFMKELDVYSHKVLFDENIPSITVRLKGGGYLEMEQHRMAIPFQELVLGKQVRHLCVNRMNHTLLNTEPSDSDMKNFVRIKQAWAEKNMEGAKTKFVQDQKSYGDAALLFFMGEDNRLHTKNINYADGYVIITHKDEYGKHILECLYYAITDEDGNQTTYIDCYDDEKMTRFTSTYEEGGSLDSSGWVRHKPVYHGFPENPLVTKRGEVAWNRGQKTIESYEALYNTFIVIQKRHGWGIIYIKGKFNQNAQKIAGQVVLNDTSLDPEADAKILTPPDPQHIIETLELMEQTIMKSCGTTFILPKDIKISGDTSGLAVELTQELDMATAQDGVIEWQNVANKMMRLFKAGLAKELVAGGEGEFATAITDFERLRIHTEFMVWKPKSEEAHNQMLATLKGAGGISQQTLVEKNTVSTPDELVRIQKEHEKEIEESLEQERRSAAIANSVSQETIVTE